MKDDRTGYTGGAFSKCPNPGKHYCLDKNIADGSFIFSEPVPWQETPHDHVQFLGAHWLAQSTLWDLNFLTSDEGHEYLRSY